MLYFCKFLSKQALKFVQNDDIMNLVIKSRYRWCFMELTISPNAGKEEFYAYLLLQDLFSGQDVCVGDDGTQKLPDIFAKDRSWGLEVTCCEELNTFDVIRDIAFGKIGKDNFDFKDLKFVNKNLPKLKMANLNKLDDKFKQTNFTTKPKVHTPMKLEEHFEFVLDKKLHKMNIKGSYNGVEQKNLIIISDFVSKNANVIRIFKTVYDRVVQKYANPFNMTFIAVNNEVYGIDKHGVMKKVKNRKQVKKVKDSLDYHIWREFATEAKVAEM